MSSPSNALDSLLTESKCCISGESNKSEMEIMNECVDALLYQDGELRPFTDNTLKLLKEAKEKVGEANAQFLEAIRLREYKGRYVTSLSRAEEMGCDHPVLYYLLGECYRSGQGGVARDESKAEEYFIKVIAGGCSLGCKLMEWPYAVGKKLLQYYLDLERQGNIGGYVCHMIGKVYGDRNSHATDYTLAKEYLQRSIDFGYVPACLEMYELINKGGNGDNVSDYYNDYYADDDFDFDYEGAYNGAYVEGPYNDAEDSAIRFLIETDEKGRFVNDERILEKVIDRLTCKQTSYYSPKPCTLRKLGFRNKGEMALHYCDVLIQRGSTIGYYRKGLTYLNGLAGISRDSSNAIEVGEQAERLGLASFDVYKYVLMNANTVSSLRWSLEDIPLNGMKGLEYGEKALQVCMDPVKQRQVLFDMAKIYETGMFPVEKNLYKALECYERAHTC